MKYLQEKVLYNLISKESKQHRLKKGHMKDKLNLNYSILLGLIFF